MPKRNKKLPPLPETIPTALLSDPEFRIRVKRRVGPSFGEWLVVEDVLNATLIVLRTAPPR